MSRWSQFWGRVKALQALVARIRTEVPKAEPLLAALEADDHGEAWRVFVSYRDVAEVLAQVPPAAQPYLGMIGPFFMQALDSVVDEAQVAEFLRGLGLLEATDRVSVPPEGRAAS